MSNFPKPTRFAAAAVSAVALVLGPFSAVALGGHGGDTHGSGGGTVAPQPAAPVALTPTVAPRPSSTKVKGRTGTRRGGRIGHAYIAYIGQDGRTTAGTGDQGLARTGFDLLGLAIFGGLALGGSACLFSRRPTLATARARRQRRLE